MKNCILLTAAAFFVACAATGCSPPEHAPVTGVVTINNRPVEGAVVTFSPKAGGRPAYGRTGPNGVYELEYTSGVKGAKLGVNQVYVTTYVPATRDDNNRVVEPGSPERIPPEYNENPNVTVEVKAGENRFDFKIQSSQETYPRTQGN